MLKYTIMAASVQRTKLFIPAMQVRSVERPRLIEQMDRLRLEGCRAILISAPAGSGKTTLAAQWLKRLAWPAGWLSLDERDNQPARFFAHLIAALQPIMPGAGGEALALLGLPGVNLEEIVTLITNDLIESAGPFVLVLDDFHAITNPVLHHTVDLLIDAQPPQMRLALLTREDPALQLARRRASGQLVELRQEDLRFSLEEALAFLNQTMDLPLSERQVETLEERTEGWIAGLQLAALSLKRTPEIERFIQDFSGSNRFILDYLLEEVLAHQPVEIQEFLLDTSILERMNAELCAAVAGKTILQSQKMLEQMARANLFVIPLDEDRRWYRYHHLFRDLLQVRLKADNPQGTHLLEQRASDWYEANGEPGLAVEYALKAHDPERAAVLIERHIAERWHTVDLDFHLLIDRLPFETIAERPSLALQSAWLCVILGQTDRVLAFVEAAEHALDRHHDPTHPADGAAAAMRAFARTLRAYLADFHDQPVELDESLPFAYAAIPEGNTGMRNSVAVVIGTLYYMEGRFDDACRYFEDAFERDRRANGTNAIPIATMRIVLALMAQGRLHEAFERLSQAESYIRERGIRRFYISGVIQIQWGEILLEWNRLDEAEAQIRAGLHLLDDWASPSARSLGYAVLVRALVARGDLVGARAVLGQADSLHPARFHPIFTEAIERARVRLLIAENNRAMLAEWALAHVPLAEQFLSFRSEPRLLDLCRVWLELGRNEEAAALLERLAGEASGRAGSRVAILALLAAARRGDPPQALPVLDAALRLALPEGYLRTFVDAGEPLRAVLAQWLLNRHPTGDMQLYNYARQVLAAFSTPHPASGSPPQTDQRPVQTVLHSTIPPAGPPVPLSRREQEVLLLMAQGLTNQQIADRLVISIRTVKKHVENIHGKLGVQNRTQAVAQARKLGLLT